MASERFYPAVTADVIVWRKVGHDSMEFLSIHRDTEPFIGHRALIGGHFENKDQSVVHAVKRELEEEGKLIVPLESFHFVKTYDSPRRDPRGRSISFLYSVEYSESMGPACAGDGTSDEMWIPVINASYFKWAFDHGQMINDWDNWRMAKEVNDLRIESWIKICQLTR